MVDIKNKQRNDILRLGGTDNLESVAQTHSSDKIGGFIEVDIGIRFKKCIEPVDSEILKPEWIFVSQDCK